MARNRRLRPTKLARKRRALRHRRFEKRYYDHILVIPGKCRILLKGHPMLPPEFIDYMATILCRGWERDYGEYGLLEDRIRCTEGPSRAAKSVRNPVVLKGVDSGP